MIPAIQCKRRESISTFIHLGSDGEPTHHSLHPRSFLDKVSAVGLNMTYLRSTDSLTG